MVEGSKFKESHVLENTKLWNKVGRMPRPLVLFRPSNSGLASFCACFRYPVLGRSCPYASRHNGGVVGKLQLGISRVGKSLATVSDLKPLANCNELLLSVISIRPQI
jgi:hypothetical protein